MSERSPTSRLVGTFSSIHSTDTLEAKWRALEADADCSFFLSWSWIGPWIRLVTEQVPLQLYECRDHERTVALAIVTSAVVHRRKLFRSKTLFLNEVLRPDLNVFIEYNGLLARTGYEASALQRFVIDTAAIDSAWDEIQLTNVPQRLWSALAPKHAEERLLCDVKHTTWIAPLVGAADLDVIFNKLSSNRRSKIRRTFKEYEKQGPLTINSASSTGEAIEYFRALGVLHTNRWNRVGVAGSFAKPQWVSFHEDVITSAFARGEIQLLRIRCGSRDIGYLYNYLWRDTVLMLQSGFASETTNVLRPGYVSHILAMQFNARNGARHYDFLIGDAEYKSALADPLPPLTSGRIQRRRIKFIAEEALVRIYRRTRRRQTVDEDNRFKE